MTSCLEVKREEREMMIEWVFEEEEEEEKWERRRASQEWTAKRGLCLGDFL